MDIVTSCTSCVFFEDHVVNGAKSTSDEGLCRYNPPISQPGPSAHGLWPVVAATDWCGRFTAQRAHISDVAA
jgi:hypothetical protein